MVREFACSLFFFGYEEFACSNYGFESGPFFPHTWLKINAYIKDKEK